MERIRCDGPDKCGRDGVDQVERDEQNVERDDLEDPARRESNHRRDRRTGRSQHADLTQRESEAQAQKGKEYVQDRVGRVQIEAGQHGYPRRRWHVAEPLEIKSGETTRSAGGDFWWIGVTEQHDTDQRRRGEDQCVDPHPVRNAQ